MKKYLVFGVIVLSVFLIYLCNMDKRVYYLALGDSSLIGKRYGYDLVVKDYLSDKKVLEKYVDGFVSDDYFTYDLIKSIEGNDRVLVNDRMVSIQNALIKADLVTLSIGNKDILNKISVQNPDYNKIYDYIDDLCFDLDRLFKLMRQYCKEDIIVVGYYNAYADLNSRDIDALFEYLNKKYLEMCRKYDIHYVQINQLFLENPSFLENHYPTEYGYRAIAGEVIGTINKTIFKA